MKKTIKIIAAIVMIALTAVACHRNNTEEPAHRIVYAVQNADIYAGSMSQPTQLNLESDEAWDEQLESFMDYVQAGNTVTFYNTDKAVFRQHGTAIKKKSKDSTKNSNRIQTTSRTEMKAWCRSMEEQGLTVVMDYDQKTGTWSGYAYALPPAMSAQVKTYICSIPGYGEDPMVLLITADTVKSRVYSTSNTLQPSAFNVGVVAYNRFNPADSGFSVAAGSTCLYLTSLLNGQPINGIHYSVAAPNFNFQSSQFTLNNLDYDIAFNFVETDGYETWVCEEDGYNVVLHVDRSTIDPSSYTFQGYMAIQMDDPNLPIISGQVLIVSEGAGSGSDCDENFNLNYADGGSDGDYGVELVSDELVIWRFGSFSWTFFRLK